MGVDVVAQAATGVQPEANGLEATRLIKAELPEIRIVIVTVADDDEHLFEAIESGAEGYLLKHMDGRDEQAKTASSCEAARTHRAEAVSTHSDSTGRTS